MALKLETVNRFPDAYNKVMLTGTIVRSGKYETFGDELDLHYPGNGIPVVRFDLNIYRQPLCTEDGEMEPQFDVARVLLWGDLAEQVTHEGPQQLLVGNRIELTGRFQSFNRVHTEEAVQIFNLSQRLFKLNGERPLGAPVEGSQGNGNLVDWDQLQTAFPELEVPDSEEQFRGKVRYVIYPDGSVLREEATTVYEVHAHYVKRIADFLDEGEQDVNKVTLLGRTKDCWYREVGDSATPQFHACLCVPRQRKGKPGRPQYDYLHVYSWRQMAADMRDAVKDGSVLLCHGRLQSRSYTTERSVKRKGKVFTFTRTHTTHEISLARATLYRLRE